MKKHEVRKRILDVGIIPVVRAATAAAAIEISHAICAGGISIVELTMTVPGAVDAIAELSRSMNDVMIGAGTVLDAFTAQRCMNAGAQFIVSPGLVGEVLKFAHGQSVLIIPGALTPTEVINAWKYGCDLVKIFPCANVGGPSYIKALKAALPHIGMVPTGGVNLANAEAFLRAGAEAIGVGGELTAAASVTDAARQFLAIVQAARV
jgi:2-dehydro-3-deoxyphosphogluconate aldolase / (4S)-4-hydroxy-2-oxoglutarate aldolase